MMPRALGHADAGPFGVNAIYHFLNMADLIAVTCFAEGMGENVAKFEAVNQAACS